MLVLNKENSPIVGSLSPTTKQAPILPAEASPMLVLNQENSPIVGSLSPTTKQASIFMETLGLEPKTSRM